MCNCCFRGYDNCILGCWEKCFRGQVDTLEAVGPTLSTGDLALFRADCHGRAAGQYLMAASPWDHSGIVVVRNGVVYIVDAGSFRYGPFVRRPLDFPGAPDAGDAWAAQKSGPQMYALTDLFAHQEAKGLGVGDGPGKWRYHRLAFRHLKKPLTEEEVGKLEDKLRELRDRPYETDSMEMTKAAVDLCDCCSGGGTRAVGSEESLFCSELTATLYKATGRLSTKVFASELLPSDFSRDHGSNLSGLCCCCWASWCCGRHCGGGNRLPTTKAERLFTPEIEVHIPAD